MVTTQPKCTIFTSFRKGIFYVIWNFTSFEPSDVIFEYYVIRASFERDFNKEVWKLDKNTKLTEYVNKWISLCSNKRTVSFGTCGGGKGKEKKSRNRMATRERGGTPGSCSKSGVSKKKNYFHEWLN